MGITPAGSLPSSSCDRSHRYPFGMRFLYAHHLQVPGTEILPPPHVGRAAGAYHHPAHVPLLTPALGPSQVVALVQPEGEFL